MRVKKIQLSNFRNHTQSAIDFSNGINFISGANAQGKTSILEALSYVCLTRSFLKQADVTVVALGSESFTIDASIETERNSTRRVRVAYDNSDGKKYILDGNEIRKSADIIGLFPIVVLSPNDFVLTGGAPGERRMFVDIVLSQVSRSYLDELMEYKRALKQRNKILLDGKLTGNLDLDLLAAWTDALIGHGARLITKRAEFANEFQAPFSTAYSDLVERGEVPRLIYEPSFGLMNDGPSVAELFRLALSHLDKVERVRGATLAGPHRDDIGFALNGLPIREFASQGQRKTFLVALKIAEFHYIKSKLSETPAMLLDDVMTELDYSRATRTISAISTLGQAFITGTDMVNFDENFLETKEMKSHFVREGTMVYPLREVAPVRLASSEANENVRL